MKHLKYIIWIWLVVLMAACEPMQLSNTEVIIENQTAVFEGNSATLTVVFCPTDATIQSVVVSYSRSSDMSNAVECEMKPCGTLTYSVRLTGLQQNTKYYVRYTVSNAVSSCILVAELSGYEYEYVDLGLSVKWATFNVGASKPEEYGDYFAWGETEPKSTYDWSTYKWCNGSEDSQTKYCTDYSCGTVDNKTTLELSDDAAHANWGGNWRMPTQAELDELSEKCAWTWTTQNGVEGYKVTSKSNGNSIFLPATGYHYDGSLENAGSHGCYWSSSLYTVYSPGACGLDFSSSGLTLDDGYYRFCGQCVRPVYASQSEQVSAPNVVTSNVTQITETKAVAGGNVTSDGGASVTERGVVYATTANPTIANNKLTCGSGTGSFTCNLTSLQPNTTYYVRAYAVNSKGTSYGEQVSFTTTKAVAAPKYVDLGLSVKWATFNVGASSPEEYGDYFAWGETEPKDYYNWSTYSYAADDVATVNWGGDWRMPTQAEQDELRSFCTWTWTTQNGVKGYRVTGTNGNRIFLPAAGYRSGSTLYNTGTRGYYWSSSLYSGNSSYAYYVSFTSNDVSRYSNDLCYGQSVRPVYGPQGSTKETITVNGVSFNMIKVEGGTFTMGATSEQGSDVNSDEKPTHQVSLSSFSIGETEVTQELWMAVMDNDPSYHSGTNLPVEMVSWNDCQTFITKLNQLTGKKFRLPTEAEWEYAARGGNKSNGYKYAGSNTLSNVAWYKNNSSTTHPVRQQEANELGLYDMSGNVYEWCQDRYGSYSSSAQTNPTGPTSGTDRVCRGGSRYDDASYCRVSVRTYSAPTSTYTDLGLRLAL